ncbi:MULTISPECIES: hypothetical protein [unclassified Phyllobacterium]|uniref:hypothetical protein n=1 Tax=unclassified Phyllobacterium TaxID=2638441 RepID=UPI003012F38C
MTALDALFWIVAVAENGEFLGEFEGVLERLEGPKSDPTTMNVWRRHHHRAIHWGRGQ